MAKMLHFKVRQRGSLPRDGDITFISGSRHIGRDRPYTVSVAAASEECLGQCYVTGWPPLLCYLSLQNSQTFLWS